MTSCLAADELYSRCDTGYDGEHLADQLEGVFGEADDQLQAAGWWRTLPPPPASS